MRSSWVSGEDKKKYAEGTNHEVVSEIQQGVEFYPARSDWADPRMLSIAGEFIASREQHTGGRYGFAIGS